MNPAEYEAMYRLEDRLWWYTGMRRITAAALGGRLTGAAGRLRILDAGCGTGGQPGLAGRVGAEGGRSGAPRGGLGGRPLPPGHGLLPAPGPDQGLAGLGAGAALRRRHVRPGDQLRRDLPPGGGGRRGGPAGDAPRAAPRGGPLRARPGPGALAEPPRRGGAHPAALHAPPSCARKAERGRAARGAGQLRQHRAAAPGGGEPPGRAGCVPRWPVRDGSTAKGGRRRRCAQTCAPPRPS